MNETHQTSESNKSGTLLMAELLSMPLEYRIEAVWKDVDTRTDCFRTLEPMELAKALNVPFESLRGIDWSDDWGCFQTVDEVSIESLIQGVDGYTMGELVELLDGEIDPERFASLISLASEFDERKFTVCEFLTGDERRIIEAHIQEERLEDDDGGGDMVCCHNIETKSGDVLQFQVTDNGYEVDVVATPYDVRDETTPLGDSTSRQV